MVGTGTIRTDVGAAGQPAHEVDQRRPDSAQAQLHAVPGALAAQHRAVHEQRRVVDARRGTARHPLGQPHRDQAGQRGGGQGVDHQQPAGPQQPARLGDGRRQVRDVLEDLAGRDHVRAAVDQRDRRDVGAHRHDAVRAAWVSALAVGPRRRAGSPWPPRAGRADPPPQPRSTSSPPPAAAGGISAPRARASQCSIAK